MKLPPTALVRILAGLLVATSMTVQHAAAAPKHNRIPILEAASLCGSGEAYSAPAGRFNTQELGWLKTLLSFRFSGEEINSSSFENYAETKVPIALMRAQLTDPKFSNWAGAEVVSLTRDLIEQRSTLRAKAASLGEGEKLTQSDPVKNYLRSADRLEKAILSRFGVTSEDNRVDCD
jgi:hypothetical protein